MTATIHVLTRARSAEAHPANSGGHTSLMKRSGPSAMNVVLR